MGYRTRDINFAAYLWCLDYEPSVEVEDGVVWFCYSESLRKEKPSYFSGRQIPAIQYARRMKQCRGLVKRALEVTR